MKRNTIRRKGINRAIEELKQSIFAKTAKM